MGRPVLVLFVMCFGLLAMAAIGGCSISSDGNSSGGGMMGGGSNTTAHTSVNERIFLAGVGTDGHRIPHSAPHVFRGSLMMGGGGCASCHSADGQGGTIRMMARPTIEAPRITSDALIAEGFTAATPRRAIRDGLDEAGQPLDTAMPRWRMSVRDLHATIG